MELIAQVKLLPDKETKHVLHETLVTLNSAANDVSNFAWENRAYSRARLQRGCYYDVRTKHIIAAQAAIHVTRKVADAYRKDKKVKRVFRLDGAVAYDDRILSWKIDQRTISIWTTNGRVTVPFTAGERAMKLLACRRGESDLVYRDGSFYLLATCREDEPELTWSGEVLGVDRGIVNIAACSSGSNHSGKGVNRVRAHNERLRARLQAKGTKSAKRLLKKRRRKE